MEVLTVDEAARVLRAARRTAQKMFHDGIIPGTKLGGLRKVEMETLPLRGRARNTGIDGPEHCV